MEDEVLRNIGKTILECECALIEIIGITIHFQSLKKLYHYKRRRVVTKNRNPPF